MSTRHFSIFASFLLLPFLLLNLAGQDRQEARAEKNKEDGVKKEVVTGEVGGKHRKYAVEVGLGIARFNPQELYDRSTGIDEMVRQYVGHYQVNITETGDFKQNKLMIPINVSLTYPLKGKWYLRGGLEYGFSNCSSSKEFTLSWLLSDETQQYDNSYKISYLMPQVGAGYHITGGLDVFASLGLGFSRFSYSEDFSTDMGLRVAGEQGQYATNTLYKAHGIAPALMLGAKYQLPVKLKKNIRAFVKLEYLLFKTNSLKGSRTTTMSGIMEEDVLEGTVYYYEWDPFRKGGFNYWDMFEDKPGTLDVRNVGKLSLNLSAIRLMIGVSF